MAKSKYNHFKALIISKEIPDLKLAQILDCTVSTISSARHRFLHLDKFVTYGKKWRKNNPDKVNAQRKRYHNKFKSNNANKGKPWRLKENEIVLAKTFPDKVLSEKLQRPVTAIQRQRCTLKQKATKIIPMKKEVDHDQNY